MANRIVRFAGPRAGKLYSLLYEGIGVHRAGKEKQRAAAGAFEALATVGATKLDKDGNPESLAGGDFPLLTLLSGATSVVLRESEREVLLAMLEAGDWPTFALKLKQEAVDLLENAERVTEVAK